MVGLGLIPDIVDEGVGRQRKNPLTGVNRDWDDFWEVLHLVDWVMHLGGKHHLVHHVLLHKHHELGHPWLLLTS